MSRAFDEIIKNEYSFFIPKLTSTALDERKAHILRAAELCFARQGFHTTTIDDVKKEARVSTGAIYTYFRNKEAMIGAILERARDDRRRALGAATVGDHGSLAQGLVLLSWVSAIFSSQGMHAARVDVNLWAEALRNPKVRKIAKGALEEATSAVAHVAEGRSSADGAGVDPNAVASVLVGLFLGLEVQAAVGVPLAAQEIVRVLATMFAPYLTEPPRAPAPAPKRRSARGGRAS